MSISRVDKLVCEVLKIDSLKESSSLRSVAIDIIVAADQTGKVAQMAAVAVSLALRTFTGEVRVHLPSEVSGLGWDNRPLADLLRFEAETFGSPKRLVINPKEIGDWRLGLCVEVADGVTADADGWVASVNNVFPSSRACAAPAAVFATCCAFAKLFSLAALRQPKYVSECWSLDLLNCTLPVTAY